ncbi:MAG TPA: hypothetical protein VI408_06855 [Gaiellaceae bacterium]
MLAANLVDAPGLTSVAVVPTSDAGAHYRSGRETAARAGGFQPAPNLNLHNYGGKTIEHLTFTHVYIGGESAWAASDMQAIDTALSAAMTDTRLNNVLAQYYPDNAATSAFKPSRVLPEPCPPVVYRDTIESMVTMLDTANGLSGFDLGTSVFCFMLPRGVVLVDGTSSGGNARHHQEEREDEGGSVAAHERDEQVDSKHGLGGYHGSVHAKHGAKKDTVYYAVGVYSEGANGIVAFDAPWKNVCATFYHELCEARTDPDVEDAIRAGNSSHANDFLGWYSPRGGEIGDIPMEEAGADLGKVMKEVPLQHGGTAPIQLQWSNAVGGPEGPISKKHAKPAAA